VQADLECATHHARVSVLYKLSLKLVVARAYFEMIITLTPAEQRTVLENISWETFETLIKETGDRRGYRLFTISGTLEIMTPPMKTCRDSFLIVHLIFT